MKGTMAVVMAKRLQAELQPHGIQLEPEDTMRLLFVLGDIDGYGGVNQDRHELALESAIDAGRDESNLADEFQGWRELIDRAMKANSFVETLREKAV